MSVTFEALPTDHVEALRSGAPDANGMAAERMVSDGQGMPCRHCLRNVPAGREALVLNHRPFAALHPYAESGPIFLCADACTPGDGPTPELLTYSPDFLVKAYNAEERIIYGTGAITPAEDVASRCETLLRDPDVAFVDVRSARNNCFLTRAKRA
ncbi:DUF1203 domain-containing protein [Boseongicola sp. H5]|uniref:DUF1203 domain-containing protein n=1 Tax=Rhodobacterales TaxID=204455 RepID=UPI001D09B5BB|nr:DUF1203 domain-containing protein [Boseongicola sp. H5]